MEFILWVSRILHTFSVAVWLGGLVYQNAVLAPLTRAREDATARFMLVSERRFVRVMWLSAVAVGASGVAMMLLDTRFAWLSYPDSWNTLLGLKILSFSLMIASLFWYSRMLKYVSAPASNGGFDERTEIYIKQIDRLRKFLLALGTVALILAISMHAQ